MWQRSSPKLDTSRIQRAAEERRRNTPEGPCRRPAHETQNKGVPPSSPTLIVVPSCRLLMYFPASSLQVFVPSVLASSFNSSSSSSRRSSLISKHPPPLLQPFFPTPTSSSFHSFAMPVPFGSVPGFLPGAASLVEQLDKRLLVVLRDSRHLGECWGGGHCL